MKTLQECMEALLPHNEVQINRRESGSVFIAIRPYDMGALWYWTSGEILQALNEAVEHRLARIGRIRPQSTDDQTHER